MALLTLSTSSGLGYHFKIYFDAIRGGRQVKKIVTKQINVLPSVARRPPRCPVPYFPVSVPSCHVG